MIGLFRETKTLCLCDLLDIADSKKENDMKLPLI